MLSPSDPGRPHHDSRRGSSSSRNMRNVDINGGSRQAGNGHTNLASNNRKFSFLRYILQITILNKRHNICIMCFINKHNCFQGASITAYTFNFKTIWKRQLLWWSGLWWIVSILYCYFNTKWRRKTIVITTTGILLLFYLSRST